MTCQFLKSTNYWLFLYSFLKNLSFCSYCHISPALSTLGKAPFLIPHTFFFLSTIKWSSVWKLRYSACSPGSSAGKDVDVGTSLPPILPQCLIGYTAGAWPWNLLLSCRAPPALQPCFLASPPLASHLSIAQGPQSPLRTSSCTQELGLQANYAKAATDQEDKGKPILKKKMKQRMHQSHGGGNSWPMSTQGPCLPQPHQLPSAPGMRRTARAAS